MYERVRYAGRTVILRNPRMIEFCGQPALAGIEVDQYGDEITPPGVDVRRRVISLDLITRRTPLVMDLTYAELRPAPRG